MKEFDTLEEAMSAHLSRVAADPSTPKDVREGILDMTDPLRRVGASAILNPEWARQHLDQLADDGLIPRGVAEKKKRTLPPTPAPRSIPGWFWGVLALVGLVGWAISKAR